MRIQPIQQPTFQMKWESKAFPNVTKSKIELDNGKKLLIRNGGWGRATIPVRKGQNFTTYYGGNNFKSKLFRFAYATGTEPVT